MIRLFRRKPLLYLGKLGLKPARASQSSETCWESCFPVQLRRCIFWNVSFENAVLETLLIPQGDPGRWLLLLPTFNRWRCGGLKVPASILSWAHLYITALTRCIMILIKTYGPLFLLCHGMRTLKLGSPHCRLVNCQGPGPSKCWTSPGWISQSIDRGKASHQKISERPWVRGCPGLTPRPLFCPLNSRGDIFPLTPLHFSWDHYPFARWTLGKKCDIFP